MILFLILILSLLIGWRVIRSVRPVGGDVVCDLAASAITGCVLLIWLGFLLRFAFSNLEEVLIPLAGLLTVIFLLVLKFTNGPLLVHPIRFQIGWTLPSRLILLGVIAPYFFFGVFENVKGDIESRGNFLDFPYHLAIANAFVEQSHFPPFHPQAADQVLIYHFLSDYLASVLIAGGINDIDALITVQRTYAVALIILLIRLFQLVGGRGSGPLFSGLFFIIGNVGLITLGFAALGFRSFPQDDPFWTFSNVIDHNLRRSYFNFLYLLNNCFTPQVPFLLGFPIALIIFCSLLRYDLNRKNVSILAYATLLTASLPLIHFHTFFVMAPMIVISWGYSRSTLRFIPLLLFLIIAISAQLAFLFKSPPIPNYSAWDVSARLGIKYSYMSLPWLISRPIFWFHVAGPTFILGAFSIVYFFKSKKYLRLEARRLQIPLLTFAATVFAAFVLLNFYRPSPNWGDSNKFFLYLNLFCSMTIGFYLSRKHVTNQKRYILWGLLAAFIFPSIVDTTARFFFDTNRYLFLHCERDFAEQIRNQTQPEDVFLTSDEILHFVSSLAKRRVYDGSYSFQNGFSNAKRRMFVRSIFEGREIIDASSLINYILVSPKERRMYAVDSTALANNYHLAATYQCGDQLFQMYKTAPAGKKDDGTAKESQIFSKESQILASN